MICNDVTIIALGVGRKKTRGNGNLHYARTER